MTYPSGGEESYSHSEKVVQSANTVPITPIIVQPSSANQYYKHENFASNGYVPLASYPTGGSSFSLQQSQQLNQGAAIPIVAPIQNVGGSNSHFSSQVNFFLFPFFPKNMTSLGSNVFRNNLTTQIFLILI